MLNASGKKHGQPPTAGPRQLLPTFKAASEIQVTGGIGALSRAASGKQLASQGIASTGSGGDKNAVSSISTTTPSGNFSFFGSPMHLKPKQAEQDNLSTSNTSVRTSLPQKQSLMAQKVPQRNTNKADVPGSGLTGATEALYEKRINDLESSIKSVDRTVKEYQPPVADPGLMHVLKHCEALAAEIDAQKKHRQVLEERARQLGKLLQHERGEREAWLVAFLKSLHATLQELTNCIDRSINDSSQLMNNSMDGTDEIMSHLIDRVDQLLIQKESELAPVEEEM